MEKRVELEKRGRPAEEIYDLNLDSCRATQIAGLTDEFKNLESLSLINAGLTSLKGFPNLANLRKLELSDNRISGGLNLLHGCPKLTSLSLSGNKIKDTETLEPLKKLPELRNLDLLNCEVANLENYREQVFALLDGLVYLDGYDRNNQEAEDDDEDVDGDDDDEDGEEDDEGDDFDEEDDDDDEDDLEEGEVGLEYLQKSGIDEDSEGEDFEPGAEDDDDDDLDDEEEPEDEEGAEESRGVKRKHDDEPEEGDDA